MIHNSRSLRRYANRFTILLAICLLLTLSTSKPASPLVMVEYTLPLSQIGYNSRPVNIIVKNSTSIFFTEQFGGRIGYIDKSVTPQVLKEIILPSDMALGDPQPWGLANGTDGALWFTDYTQNRIGRIDTGAVLEAKLREWTIPTNISGPNNIVVNGTGGVWFTEWRTGKIGLFRIDVGDPNKGIFYEWQLPNTGCQPNDIIVSNNTVYFTEYSGDRIGAFNVSSQYLTEYSLPSGSAPWGLVSDPEGMIWFTCSGRNVIGVLNPYTGDVTEHRSIPTDNSQPRAIAFDNITKSVWFTEYAGHKIAKYVPNENLFYEYPTLTKGSGPNDIAIQRYPPNSVNVTIDGTIDIWFTEYAANRIGHMSQGGTDWKRFGTTVTTTVTTLTSAVSATYTIASSSTRTSRSIHTRFTHTSGLLTTGFVTSTRTLSATNTTSAVLTETAYKLSTSTFGTSTSFIVEVAYTSATSTSTSTTYVSTLSVTSSTTSTSISTSYISTTLVTSTSTSYVTVNTGTVTRTSTTAVSIPNTLTTTVTETKYKSTTSGTTSTTSTSTVTLVSTSISYTTFPTTITKTTTSGKTTFTIPPIPTKCIIASAAYGSELSPQVQALRTFRDKIVLSTFAGTQFMKAFNAWYYSFSPTLGGLVSESQWIAASARALIYPLIGILQVAAATYAMFSFNPELGVTVAGVLGSSLIGIVYCTPWVTALLIGVKRKRRFEMGMRHLIPFVTSWIVGLFLIGVAMLLLAPILMMIATAAVVLLSLGLSATGVAMLISRKLTGR